MASPNISLLTGGSIVSEQEALSSPYASQPSAGGSFYDPSTGQTGQAVITYPSVTQSSSIDLNSALPDPLLSLAAGNLNGLPSASSSSATSPSCSWYDITCELNSARNAVGNTNFGDTSTPAPGILGGLANAAGLTIPGLGGSGSALAGITWGRVGAFL
jgi:hypothetical protein